MFADHPQQQREFSSRSQVAPQSSNIKIWFCKCLRWRDLVGASGFEPEASCAQGKL
jgi:hypothetical protein